MDCNCDHSNYDDYFEVCSDCHMTQYQIHVAECVPLGKDVPDECGYCSRCGFALSEAIPGRPETYTNYRALNTDALIRRMQAAPDFGYDDEAVELNRRLKHVGQTWRWKGDRVEIVDLDEDE